MAAPPCETELRKIYDGIMALAAGKSTVSISFGERSVSYNAAQLASLQKMYGIFYRTCGVASGLPDLSAANEVQRGRPMTYKGY